jgi:hypothetical protein
MATTVISTSPLKIIRQLHSPNYAEGLERGSGHGKEDGDGYGSGFMNGRGEGFGSGIGYGQWDGLGSGDGSNSGFYQKIKKIW